MSSGQLRNKIFQLMTFIDGQFSGGYDYQDMHDTDFGHLATLVDMIDVYNMSNPDNRMEYPKTRDETMRPVDWTPYMVNESRTVRITKNQLRRIIKEEKAKIVNENYEAPGVSRAIQELGRLKFMFEDEINSACSRHVRDWHKNETIMREISMMLDELAAQMEKYREL